MDPEISGGADYRAALYIRLSKEDESEGPSESVNNQKSLLEGFVRERRLSVFDTYIDDGWSGTGFDRPAFRRMIGDIEAKKVNMVITKDLSRLGRDYIMTGFYMERFFPEHRVRYISLLDGIDTGVESGANDITPFRAIMNDMYARDISRKIRSVKRDKQRRGQFIGGKPAYGYKMHPTEKNRIVVDEAAAPIVRRVFSMALAGMSCRKIAAQLNAEGVPTPAAYAGWRVSRPGPCTGLWSSERISDMLGNEVYIGNMVQGRSVRVSYKSKKCRKQSREDWIVVEGTHEPLVDAETFARVRMLVDSRRHTRSRKYDFLLKGMIFCHECGHPLGVMNRPPVSGEDRLFFICRTYQRFAGAGVCSCHCIREAAVTEAVVSKVRAICGAHLDPGALEQIAVSAIGKNAQDPEVIRRELRGRLDRLTASLDQLYLDRLSGLLTQTDHERICGRIQAERRTQEDRLRALEAQKDGPVSAQARAKALVQAYMDAACVSRESLVSLIERIELTGDKRIIIRFRFRDPEAAS